MGNRILSLKNTLISIFTATFIITFFIFIFFLIRNYDYFVGIEGSKTAANHYAIIIWLAILITFICILIGSVVLVKIMEPIINAGKAAEALSKGEHVNKLKAGKFALKETVELINVVNNTIFKLNEAEQITKINELKDNELLRDLKMALEEIKIANKIERDNLEKLVAERKKEIEKVTKELIDKEKLASLGGLVSGIAHEINTPLGVAVTAASYMKKINDENIKLVEEGIMTKSDFVKYMESMGETTAILNTNISRAAELVKSFKLIAVNQSLEQKSKFLLREYIETILISLKHEYKKMDIRVNIECAEELIIDSYPGAFSQIMTNFIMNSLTHGFNEKRGGLIDINVSVSDGILKFIYSDNGKGIKEENFEKIFDPFFTTNRNAGGSGLGLSVVFNIVTGQLNGEISCNSVLGEGTTFTIKIPLERIE